MTRERIDVGGLLFDNVNMAEALERAESKITQPDLFAQDSALLMAANQDIFNHIGIYKNLSQERLKNPSCLRRI